MTTENNQETEIYFFKDFIQTMFLFYVSHKKGYYFVFMIEVTIHFAVSLSKKICLRLQALIRLSVLCA